MKITEAIDSVAFKHALFEGKVEFDYDKVDKATGKRTPRHAIGTMNEALLPKTEPMAKFKCTEIKWYTDEPWPTRKTIYLPKSKVDNLTVEELEDLIANTIPDACGCGFVVESFRYERIEDNGNKPKKSFPDDSVFYYDLEKKAFRSFKLANLKGWKSC
jgi:hypothetical protein